MGFPLSQNTVGVCKEITLPIPYYNSSRLVTLKIIDALKLINFNFQIFLLFVPEMCTGFTSSIVLDFLRCFGFDPLTTAF
jgi:hypothetical protein